MSDASTPSFSQFMKAHRAAGVVTAHDHDDVERLACCGFGWGIPSSSARVYVPPASDAPPPGAPVRFGGQMRRRGTVSRLRRNQRGTDQMNTDRMNTDPLGRDPLGPAE